MAYAVNTSFNVLRFVDTGYYACVQGAWFTAPTPTGGVAACRQRAAGVIYNHSAVQPALSMHLRARVYAATPTSVTYGYSAGYTMGFINAGVVVYGTGTTTHRTSGRRRLPVFYPWPITYRGATYYNPATGAWARWRRDLRAVLRCARRAARTTRRPAPTRGGGLGVRAVRRRRRVLGLQPEHRRLCARQRGLGPRRRGRQRELVQPAHRHLGLDAAERPTPTVTGARAPSPARTRRCIPKARATRAARRDRSVPAPGAPRGAGVHGAGGNNAGAVEDGGRQRLCRRRRQCLQEDIRNGWQKYSNGAWAPVTPPSTDSNPRAAEQQADSRADPQARPGAAEARRGPGAEGSGGWQQLENDRAAREGGAERQRQFSGQAGRLGGGFQRRR